MADTPATEPRATDASATDPSAADARVTKRGVQSLYLNRRMAALLGLGFAAGLPSAYKLLGSTPQAWLGDLKYNVKDIGLVTLVSLPFAFNFVWAPLLDRYVPPFMGRRRGWLLLIQLALVVAIAGMGLAGPTAPGQALHAFVIVAVLVAFLAATQDVVADAYRTDILPDAELGAGAAVFVNGYRIAMLAAGGGALMLSGYMSWREVYFILAGLMCVGIIATLLAPDPPRDQQHPATLHSAIVEPLQDLFNRHRMATLAILLFIVLFKLPDAMANAMTMPLLQKELLFDKQTIALVRDWMGLALIMLGAICGGGITARIGLVPSLWLFGALQALSNLGFLILAMNKPSVPLLAAVVVVESFCAGLVAAGFIAYLMSLCNRRYSATQYALFTSLMYGAGLLVGGFTGFMVAELGYVTFFLLSVLAAAPGMAILPWLSRQTRRPG